MSSNKKWPSLFKSKTSTSHYHHDNSPYLHNSNYNVSSSISPDRVPDPKPRWNPKPEQVRILESIFNSGMVNPPRDEIKRIRIQLEEYGPLGDANVFYWFQNRKSRAKNKLRLQQIKPKISKKDKISSPCTDVGHSFHPINQGINLSTCQNNEFVMTESISFQFPVHNDPRPGTPEFDFSDFVMPVVTEEELSLSAVNNGNMPVVTEEELSVSVVNNGINAVNNGVNVDDIPDINFYSGNGYGGDNWYSCGSVTGTVLSTSQFQGEQDVGSSSGGEAVGSCVPPMSLTVFINDMPYQVVAGLFNVKEAFGNNAMLINSFGHPVLTDDSGLTYQPLQNGGFYYLI